MTSVLLFGFLIGMRHALEADHVAAVASLVSRNHSISNSLKHGAVWGLGHSITLVLFGSIVILMDSVVPEQFALGLEFAVGFMLIVLGVDVLRRLVKDKIHFHAHKHVSEQKHFHAHSHSGEIRHNPESHEHEHRKGFPVRALFIGLMHGMAGSAALMLLTLQTVSSPLLGLFYMALFGLGSITGMAALSVIISFPLRHSATGISWLYNVFHVAIGITTIVLGIVLAYESRTIFV